MSQNDQLRQDLSDYKMQVQAQRENIMSHQGDDVGFREKLARKNHELAEAMEELQVSYWDCTERELSLTWCLKKREKKVTHRVPWR